MSLSSPTLEEPLNLLFRHSPRGSINEERGDDHRVRCSCTRKSRHAGIIHDRTADSVPFIETFSTLPSELSNPGHDRLWWHASTTRVASTPATCQYDFVNQSTPIITTLDTCPRRRERGSRLVVQRESLSSSMSDTPF